MNDEPRAPNGHPVYSYLTLSSIEPGAFRWVGRCKRCKITRRLEGMLAMATRMANTRYARRDRVVQASDGQIYMTGDLGTNPTLVTIKCQDHWVALKRVYDSFKPGAGERHECNVKCTGASGPACECKCKGANHGAG